MAIENMFEAPIEFSVVCVKCGEHFWIQNTDKIKPGYTLTVELKCRCSDGKLRTSKVQVPVVRPSPWLIPTTANDTR